MVSDTYMKEYYQENKERIKSKTSEYRKNNKEIISIKKKEYREANKENIKDYATKFRKEHRIEYRVKSQNLRDWIISFKDVPCVDCGGEFPPECMDFDHVRGEKLFEISRPSTNRDKILEEMDKCEIVCANCHRTRTRKRKKGVNNV